MNQLTKSCVESFLFILLFKCIILGKTNKGLFLQNSMFLSSIDTENVQKYGTCFYYEKLLLTMHTVAY